MKKNFISLRFVQRSFLCLLSFITINVQAQFCGHTDTSWAHAIEKLQTAGKGPQHIGAIQHLNKNEINGIRYIPLTIHFIRNSQGSFSINPSVKPLYHTLMMTNKILNPIGIQFYVNANVDYIDNDDYLKAAQGSAKNLEMKSKYKNTETANLYVVDGWAGSQASGYASPEAIELAGLGVDIAPHEIGHFLGLAHTFDTGNGIELVSRTNGNCSTAGDGIADTDADPYGLTAEQVKGNVLAHSNCIMTSDTHDANNDLYTPPFDNYMSYYGGFCGFRFTPGQYARMSLTYTTYHAAYGVMTGNGICAAPSSLAVSHRSGYNVLVWKNAAGAVGTSFEMSSDNGKHWEVMTAAMPEEKETVLSNLKANTSYKFRARHLNSLAYSNEINYKATTAHVSVPVYPAAGLDGPGIGSVVSTDNAINNTGNVNNNFTVMGYAPLPEAIVGGKLPLQLKVKTNGQSAPGAVYFSVWIDENEDGDFDNATELKFHHPADNKEMYWSLDTTLQLSASAKPGITRMRVRGLPQYNRYDPVMTYNFSETEDYAIRLVADTTPSTFNAVYNPKTGKVDITWTEKTNPFAWQIERSADGLHFETIATPDSAARSFSDIVEVPDHEYAYRLRHRYGVSYTKEASVFVPAGANNYCTPVSAMGCECNNPAAQNSWYGVSLFKISEANFENNSDNSCSITQPGYSDYYGTKTINLQAGKTYNFQLQARNTQLAYASIYGDADHNAVFDATDTWFSGTNIDHGSFTVPANAINGETRLRVRGYYNPIKDACSEAAYGETEDYKIIISGGKENAVSELSVNNVSEHSLDLSWTKQSYSNPSGYLIEYSTDGKNFQQLASVNNSTNIYGVSGLQSGTKYYFSVVAQGTINSNADIAWATTTSPATDITTQKINTFTLAPNPAHQFVSIEAPEGIKTIRISNMQGRIVVQQAGLNQTSCKLSIDNLHEGFYIVQLCYSDGSTASSKLIVR